MNRIAGMVAAVLATACWGAHAQTPPAAPLKMDTGFYLGGGLGSSSVRDFCNNAGGACDKKDNTWNLFAGYQVNRYFAVELGYADLGEATTSGVIAGIGTRFTERTKVAELVAVGLLPLGDHFSLYGKIGGVRFDSDGSASGAFSASGSDKGTELTLGVGAQYDFDGRIAARIEMQRYFDVGSGVIVPKSDINVVRATARYKF